LLLVATQHYRQKQWAAALDALDAAYALHPAADILFNRAQTCREAGAERAALSLYDHTAAQSRDEVLKTSAQKRAAELRRKLSRAEERAAVAKQKEILVEERQRLEQKQQELAEKQRRFEEQQALLTAHRVPDKPPALKRKLHQRWWFWTAIGGAVAAVVVVSAATAYAFPIEPSYQNLQPAILR
jgi:hypothetical protein